MVANGGLCVMDGVWRILPQVCWTFDHRTKNALARHFSIRRLTISMYESK